MTLTEEHAPRGPQARYEVALAEGRFEIQRCDGCNAYVFYPRQLCPRCGSTALSWAVPSGLGTVYSATTVRLDPNKPHDILLIDLDEGVRLMSRVVDRGAGQVRIGQRVRARVAQQAGAVPLLVFECVGGAV